MKKWFKRNQKMAVSDAPSEEKITTITIPTTADTPAPSGLLTRLRQGLSKTRHQLGDGLSRLLLGKKEIDAHLLDELETLLIKADLGINTTEYLLQELTDGLKRKQLADGDAVFVQLKQQLQSLLAQQKPLTLTTSNNAPFVILMVGVNGTGKTTTIGKLAKHYQQQGKKVLLAAGDTFRAAAIEQLQVWGQRNHIPVIAQHTGADSASVIFDAIEAATARGIDVIIADTAGRLHTQHHLMDELKKITRVIKKINPEAPHETMLVLDAGIGQNALAQAHQFHNAVTLTGITMTKLDGTAKGGILFAIAHELGIPFRYIGVGEGIDDLRPFDAAQFVDAVFNDDHI